MTCSLPGKGAAGRSLWGSPPLTPWTGRQPGVLGPGTTPTAPREQTRLWLVPQQGGPRPVLAADTVTGPVSPVTVSGVLPEVGLPTWGLSVHAVSPLSRRWAEAGWPPHVLGRAMGVPSAPPTRQTETASLGGVSSEPPSSLALGPSPQPP